MCGQFLFSLCTNKVIWYLEHIPVSSVLYQYQMSVPIYSWDYTWRKPKVMKISESETIISCDVPKKFSERLLGVLCWAKLRTCKHGLIYRENFEKVTQSTFLLKLISFSMIFELRIDKFLSIIKQCMFISICFYKFFFFFSSKKKKIDQYTIYTKIKIQNYSHWEI